MEDIGESAPVAVHPSCITTSTPQLRTASMADSTPIAQLRPAPSKPDTTPLINNKAAMPNNGVDVPISSMASSLFAALAASAAETPLAVSNSLLAGEPPLADSSNAASYNKIWQQHDENKTWQQQALDVEKAGVENVKLESCWRQENGVQLGHNRSGRNIGMHCTLSTSANMNNNNNNMRLSTSYGSNTSGGGGSGLIKEHSDPSDGETFFNNNGLSNSFGSRQKIQHHIKGLVLEPENMRRMSSAADMSENWRNRSPPKMMMQNGGSREQLEQLAMLQQHSNGGSREQLEQLAMVQREHLALAQREQMNQLAGVREATWQPNSHPADPLNVHHERQTGYVGRENTGGVGGGSWKDPHIVRENSWSSQSGSFREQTSIARETSWSAAVDANEKWRQIEGPAPTRSESWRASAERGSSSSSEENWRLKESAKYQGQDENWRLKDGLNKEEAKWRQRDALLLNNPDKWKKDPLSTNLLHPEDKWKPKYSSGGQMIEDKWRVSDGSGGRPEWPLDPNWRPASGTVNPVYLANIPSPALATPPSWFANMKPGEKDFRFEGFSRDDCISREGLSRESSRDDINSVCDQQFEYEEKFRVDRRKLELMIIGSGDSQLGEAAAAFFDKISRETDTTIIWPSRLKIGAKSKKDPHIRVGGQEEGVKIAKARITEVLDTRVNSRVTIKMDVSYTDHSHIIGKGGNTIRRVMTDTNCHIHFPDSNRSNPNEKSNQVSIAGEMAGVERARARVRELTPLIFQFDLAIVPSFHTIPDQSNSYLRAIQDQYNVQVSFRQKQKNFHTVTVVIKGCELEASRVKEATLLLMDHLWPNNITVSTVNMTMEISPGHHAIVVGKGSINLRVIMQRTNTVIIFPDAGDPNIPPIRKGSVTISGAIHNVYLARQLLLGSLPIVMMFDVPDSIDIDESMIQKLQAENEVTITIKPKARQSNKSCIIKSQERNVGGMYVGRHKLLDLEGDIVKAEVPETYKVPMAGSSSTFHLASLPANRGPFLCPTAGAGNPHLQAFGSPLSPNFIPSPAVYTPLTPTMPPGSPWNFPTAGAAGAGAAPHSLPIPASQEYSRLSPTQYQLQEFMLLNALKHQQQEAEKKLALHQQHQHHIKQLQQHQLHQQQLAQLQQQQIQKHQQQQLQHQQALQQQKQREEMELEKKKWCSPPNVSKIGPSGSDLGSSMQSSPHHSPRNSSPVNAAGNLTNNLHKMDLTGCSSGIEANPDISAIIADIDLSDTDRRAPGCEKKVAENVDYEQKRIRATQAVLRKPVDGEERTPVSDWVGLGFSSSMPAEAILKNIDSTIDEGKEKLHEKAHTTWLSNLNDIKEVPEEKLDDLGNVLLNNGLSKFTDVFRRHEIDLPTFKELTEEELKEIGINTFGPRKKLLLLAEKLRSA